MSNNWISFEEGQVCKHYSSRIARDQEYSFLTMFDGTGLVPTVLSQKEHSLTITKVEGTTLLSLLEQVWAEQLSEEAGRRLLDLLTEWLLAVNRHFEEQIGKSLVLRDPNFCNFIVTKSEGAVIGIDFEDWYYGASEETPAMLLGYLDRYHGGKSPVAQRLRDNFRKGLIDRLSLNETLLSEFEKHCGMKLELRRLTAVARRESTAVILAGGRSVRMGYPKKSLKDGDYTFLERILYTLSSFDSIAISVEKASDLGVSIPVWADVFPGCGPLGGLLTALTKAKTPLVFLTACDMPGITEELIFYLYHVLEQEDDCLIPVTDGRVQPLFGIYRTTLLPQVEAFIKKGEYRIQALLDRVITHYLPLTEPYVSQLMNINTPEDYTDWQGRRL